MADKRQREIEFLQKLRGLLQDAKQEINNDLTRLAIRNLPMLMPDDDKSRRQEDEQQQQSSQPATLDDQGNQQQQQQHLEPLDLDV